MPIEFGVNKLFNFRAMRYALLTAKPFKSQGIHFSGARCRDEKSIIEGTYELPYRSVILDDGRIIPIHYGYPILAASQPVTLTNLIESSIDFENPDESGFSMTDVDLHTYIQDESARDPELCRVVYINPTGKHDSDTNTFYNLIPAQVYWETDGC